MRGRGVKLSELTRALLESGIEDARGEARLLFSHFGGFSRGELFGTDPECESEALTEATERRKRREPLQYVIGEVGFYREKYRVTPACLIPRPETELLVDYAIKNIPEGEKILDLCTGSGCIAISTVKNSPLSAVALDISEEALGVARENAELCGVSDRISFIKGDALSGRVEGDFFAVLSNPPYVTEREYASLEPELYFEPKTALVGGGEDGAEFYEKITALYIDSVSDKGGFIAFEIGSGQSSALERIAALHGARCEIILDYASLPRIAVLRK